MSGLATCPPWCSYQHDGDGDDLHMSDSHPVPCAVTARADGHCCGYTITSDPAYAQESCTEPNFAQLCADETGQVWVEVGHGGGDLIPAMTIEAAGQLAACLAKLVGEAQQARPA